MASIDQSDIVASLAWGKERERALVLQYEEWDEVVVPAKSEEEARSHNLDLTGTGCNDNGAERELEQPRWRRHPSERWL